MKVGKNEGKKFICEFFEIFSIFHIEGMFQHYLPLKLGFSKKGGGDKKK